MAYSDEVLDGFNEMVAQFGTSVSFVGNAAAYDALPVFPTAGDDSKNAGVQLTAGGGLEMRRSDFVAAGVNQDSRFTVAGQTLPLQVDAIEDDGVQSVIYFSVREVE